ncbi:glycine--tRNA ligase [Nibricoccus aquaticus]|uniref:Glycine--tRNA ligase n=1 Tax=Nibricoccus aquaticus TaxID=2576891 RepID=A0A290Q679_9BACT|nr:glycine--tRNA ligase [Nibricoccus aquaticus]ATC64185.1 glycine--tRNA ligase [Nibricoccus aquaticus]
MSTPAPSAEVSMETIVALCKRRGFIFQSSEIYGGFNGFFDYGPLGVELKKNIRDCWWNDMVRRRDDVVGLESSIIMHPKVWEASGHVAGFSDPLVDCKTSKQRFRADQLFFSPVVIDGKTVGYVSALESERTTEELQAAAESFKRKKALQGTLAPVTPKDFTEAREDEHALIPSPATGEPGSLTAPRAFNMMFQTNVGAMTDGSSVAYLRPETAQGMFVDFKNVVDTGRVKLPFGIAQIGKSFRNEITPRNFIFRSREFEQMEMEYFIHEDADWKKSHDEWIEWCRSWLLSIGLPESHLSLYTHPKEKLSFYSRGTVDIMFKYPFGVQELWGIAARGNYDLTQHANASGKPQEIFDEATKKKFVPHVIEPAVGTDRIFLATLCAGYAEEDVTDEKGNTEKRVVLRLSPRIAPVKVAVLPLLKNKEALTQRAQALYKKLQRRYAVFYDESGAIGKRYRRQDEIGTPWCVTIDFDTIEKPGDTFTLRERDSMTQKRITESDLFALLEEQVY